MALTPSLLEQLSPVTSGGALTRHCGICRRRDLNRGMRVAEGKVTGQKRRAPQGFVKELPSAFTGDAEAVANASKRRV
ncbi:MAG: hypothetical protein AB1762_21015, partial [Gemmatimonadota bacterium]